MLKLNLFFKCAFVFSSIRMIFSYCLIMFKTLRNYSVTTNKYIYNMRFLKIFTISKNIQYYKGYHICRIWRDGKI